MRLKNYSTLIMVSLVIIACQSKEDETPPLDMNKEFFNLKLGNE